MTLFPIATSLPRFSSGRKAQGPFENPLNLPNLLDRAAFDALVRRQKSPALEALAEELKRSDAAEHALIDVLKDPSGKRPIWGDTPMESLRSHAMNWLLTCLASTRRSFSNNWEAVQEAPYAYVMSPMNLVPFGPQVDVSRAEHVRNRRFGTKTLQRVVRKRMYWKGTADSEPIQIDELVFIPRNRSNQSVLPLR